MMPKFPKPASEIESQNQMERQAIESARSCALDILNEDSDAYVRLPGWNQPLLKVEYGRFLAVAVCILSERVEALTEGESGNDPQKSEAVSNLPEAFTRPIMERIHGMAQARKDSEEPCFDPDSETRCFVCAEFCRPSSLFILSDGQVYCEDCRTLGVYPCRT